jgi:hypothetical protein
MRLAQAARKFAITTEDIISYLLKNNITIVKDSNTKLDETAIELLYSNYGVPEEKKKTFVAQEKEVSDGDTVEVLTDVSNTSAPDDLAAELPTEVNEKENLATQAAVSEEEDAPNSNKPGRDEISDEAIAPEISADLTESDTIIVRERKYKTVSDLLEEPEQENAAGSTEMEEEIVIKAPIINLKGLNVLGKIELPEPKEKKTTTIEGEEKKLARTSKKELNRVPKKHQRTKERKVLSPQELRSKEKRKADSKRKSEEAAKKKQREEYYSENVLKPKQKAQKRKQREKKSPQINPEQHRPIVEEKPKTAFGKFWKWLNT